MSDLDYLFTKSINFFRHLEAIDLGVFEKSDEMVIPDGFQPIAYFGDFRVLSNEAGDELWLDNQKADESSTWNFKLNDPTKLPDVYSQWRSIS